MKLSARQRSPAMPGRGPRAAATPLPPPPRSPLSLPRPRPRRRPAAPSAAAAAPAPPGPGEEAPPPPALLLPGPDGGDPRGAHARNAAAISYFVRTFLDDEWRLELSEHLQLGEAAAAAYKEAVAAAAPRPSSPSSSSPPSPRRPRLDVGDVLLAVASDLSARPELFRETFTDAFEVANKVSELLVHDLSGGETECGCVGEASVALMVEAFEFADGEVRARGGEGAG